MAETSTSYRVFMTFKKKGGGRKRISGHQEVGHMTQVPGLVKDQLGGGGQIPAEQATELIVYAETDTPRSPQGRHCWPPTQPRSPGLCLTLSPLHTSARNTDLCPSSHIRLCQPVSPPLEPFQDSLAQSLPPFPVSMTDSAILLWSPQAHTAGKMGAVNDCWMHNRYR